MAENPLVLLLVMKISRWVFAICYKIQSMHGEQLLNVGVRPLWCIILFGSLIRYSSVVWYLLQLRLLIIPFKSELVLSTVFNN